MSIADDIINGTFGTNNSSVIKKKKKDEESLSVADRIINGTFENSSDESLLKSNNEKESLADRIINGTYGIDKNKETQEDNNKWFKRGALSDGYQTGDILKTVAGSAADLGTGLTKGIMNIGEGIGDLITYGRSEISQLQGNNEKAEELKKKAQVNAVNQLFNPLQTNIDKNSVFGNKSDNIIESLGYVAGLTAVSIASGGAAGALGAGTVGTTAAASIGSTATTFSNAMGNGLNQAYKDGANDDDAWKYGAIAGMAEAGSELMFGGLGKYSKAIGLGKSGIPIDDVLSKKVSSIFKSTLGKNLSEYVIKSGSEGTEEVVSGFIQALGQKLTYKKDEDLNKLVNDQHLLEQFVSGAITSAIAQAPGGNGIYKTTTEGRDFITGMTKNESKIYDTEINSRTQNKQKENVVNKMYQERIETLKKAGVELNSKEQNNIKETIIQAYDSGRLNTKNYKLETKITDEIENQVKRDFEEGNISTEKIKNILGENQDISKDKMLQKSIYEEKQKSIAYQIQKTDNEKVNNLYKSALEAGLNNTTKARNKIEIVAKLTQDTDRQYKFASPVQLQKMGYNQNANGVINKETGEILINSHSNRGIQSIIGHETTHIFDSKDKKGEYSEEYKVLQDSAIEYAKQNGIYNEKVKNIMNAYETQSLNESQLKEELTADLVGDFLFNDEKFITNLSTKNRNVFQKIYDYIKRTFKSVTIKDSETRALENMKQQFEKVYKTIPNIITSNNIKYSIKKNKNGIQYVNVDTDQNIFDGKKSKEYPKIAKEYILKNFRDENQEISLATNEKVNVIRRTANEYSFPKNELNTEKKNSKMKASTELDNLVKISTYQSSALDDGRHAFAKDGWDYYKTTFKVDGKIFEGLVNIGKNGDNKTLYDITNIKEIPHISYGKNLPESLSISPLDNNITKETKNQDTKNIKNSLAKEKVSNSDIPVKKLLKIEDIIDPYLKKNNINRDKENLDKIIEGIKEINIKNTRHDVIQDNRKLARTMITDIAKWKDKGRGFLYSINTMKRNLRDVAGNEKGAELYNEYFKPITKNNAKIEKEINQYNERVESLKLNDIESSYVQMIGEAKYNPETKLLPDQIDKFYEKNKKKIDKAKSEMAVEEFRNIYDELIVKVNKTLTDNGYDEVGYRKGYFPHFIEDKAESIIGKMAEKLGWKINKDTLPTDIAGITEQFLPGKTWTSFSQKRTGDATDYNALKGFDNYIRGAMDVIYHTKDIQKLRALEAEIRYQYSEKGIQERIDEIFNNDSLDMEAKYEAIEKETERIHNPMGNLAVQLRSYTNSLANKKNSLDRGMEGQIGRDTYSIMTNIQNRVSANMVGANISSAMTNFIPITQAWSQISTKNLMRGMMKSVETIMKDDGFSDYSTFLTNRTQKANRLFKTKLEKANDIVGSIFELVDDFTSNTIVRGKYYENLDKGMSQEKAIDNADEFAKDIISGRSKGDQPTIFNSKNPLVRLYTAFQLEVNNQYGYMLKDLPTDFGGETKDKLIGAFIKLFLGAYIYNFFSEKILNRKSAFSPIDMAVDSINTINNEKSNSYDKFKAIGTDLLGNAPFVGGLIGGGRLPISSAIPDITIAGKSVFDIFDNEVEDKTSAINNLKSELMKPVYYVALPFAGGQLKKTLEGLNMFNDNKAVAGSYTNSGKLRFTVEEDNWTKIQAALFGQYASKEAKEYFNNGNKTLTDKELSEMLDLNMKSSEYRNYKEGLKEAKKTEDNNGYIKYYDNEKNVYWYDKKNDTVYDSNYKETNKSILKLTKESSTEAIFDYISGLNVSDEQKNKMANNAVSRNKDSNGYAKYTDSKGNNYWYDTENQILYDSDYDRSNKSLSSLTKSTIDISEYSNYDSLEEYDYATKNPEKYNVIKQITTYNDYSLYKNEIDKISEVYSEISDGTNNSKQKELISNKKRKEIFQYIDELDLNKAQKIMLFKMAGGYSIKNYKSSMFDYINNLDMTRDEKTALWGELY